MYINTGAAWRQILVFWIILSLDFHPINQPIGLGRMTHFGFELGTYCSVMGGWAVYHLWSWHDIWLMKLRWAFITDWEQILKKRKKTCFNLPFTS